MDHKLIYYGNDILRTVSEDIKNINQEIADLSKDMFKLMYKEKGVGLAGPQINEAKKIITIDINDRGTPCLTLINPIITAKSDRIIPYEEGCLSLPGINMEILRPLEITVKGYTLDEKEITINADGLLARVLQHEIDHINGIVFIDHLEDHLKKSLRADLKRIKKLNRES